MAFQIYKGYTPINTCYIHKKYVLQTAIILVDRIWGGSMFAMRYKNIGLRIAYYRKKKDLTQASLAQKVGMSASYLGQIERGNRGNSFSLEILYQIADALEVDVNLLMKEDNEGI